MGEGGNCDSDRRHLFNMTALTATPESANRGLNAVFGDWTFSSILCLSSAHLSMLRVDETGRAWPSPPPLLFTVQQSVTLKTAHNPFIGRS